LVAGAWPENAVLLLDFLVGDAAVVGHAALAGAAEFVENLFRPAVGKALGPAERGGDVLNDAPVLARIAGGVNRLVDLDDPTFDLRDRALVLLVQRAGQYHVGVPGRLAHEKINGHEELELVEHAPDILIIRQ